MLIDLLNRAPFVLGRLMNDFLKLPSSAIWLADEVRGSCEQRLFIQNLGIESITAFRQRIEHSQIN